MAQVKVTSKVKHNGVIFEAGEVVGDLSEAEARALVNSGAAEFADKSAKASAGKKQGPRTSKVKESLLGQDGNAKGGAKKTVAEKAQKRAQAGAKAKDDVDTSSDDETPAGGQDDSQGNDTPPAGNDGDDQSDGNDDSKDPAGDDEAKASAGEFELNGAVFSTKAVGKDGKQTKYYKQAEGEDKPVEIKKVDYLTAQQEAQG